MSNVNSPNKGGAPKGNLNRVAIKDPDVRQDAYRQYCAHLANGKSKRSFVFKHPKLTVTWQSLEKYLVDEVEFNPIQKEVALAEGYSVWEDVCDGSAKGENQANTASLQMVMRNKFGWDRNKDKEGDEVEAESRTVLNQMANAIDNGIKLAQRQS